MSRQHTTSRWSHVSSSTVYAFLFLDWKWIAVNVDRKMQMLPAAIVCESSDLSFCRRRRQSTSVKSWQLNRLGEINYGNAKSECANGAYGKGIEFSFRFLLFQRHVTRNLLSGNENDCGLYCPRNALIAIMWWPVVSDCFFFLFFLSSVSVPDWMSRVSASLR